MERIFDPQFYLSQWEAARTWLADNAVELSVSAVGQAIIVVAAFLVARQIAPRARAALARATEGRRLDVQLRHAADAVVPLTLPVAWLLLLWLAVLIARQGDLRHHLLTIVVSLLTAWVVIRLTASLVRDPVWSRFVTVVAWTIAALSILNLLGPTMALLDSIAITLADLRISALTVVQAMLSLAVLLWLATVVSRVLERRITASPNLTPSLQVLMVKLLKFALVAIAVAVALRTVGIDLTAFAVFTGAVGVGIGFGLQKSVSNFISGLTILIDKSIKPGDVIAVGDTYGWVDSLGSRHVSVITRDGTEYLLPNEQLIAQQVVNWSYSNNEVRLKLPVGIAYGADVRRAIALCQEAAERNAARIQGAEAGLPGEGLRRQCAEPGAAPLDQRSAQRRLQREERRVPALFGQVPRAGHRDPAARPAAQDAVRASARSAPRGRAVGAASPQPRPAMP